VAFVFAEGGNGWADLGEGGCEVVRGVDEGGAGVRDRWGCRRTKSKRISVPKIRFDDYTYSTVPCGYTVRYRIVQGSTFYLFIFSSFCNKKPHCVRSRTALAMLWRLVISSPAIYTLFCLVPPLFFTGSLFSASTASAFLFPR
jgi:hypothetical protein